MAAIKTPNAQKVSLRETIEFYCRLSRHPKISRGGWLAVDQ